MMPLMELPGNYISLLASWSDSWGDLVVILLARELQDSRKYWAPEGTHKQHLAEDTFVLREIRKRGKSKTSCFSLVFQKDGLVYKSKPHSCSQQWALREGSQQPHAVTSCRCCRKSDRDCFHQAITTSHLEFAFPSVPRIKCCWWRKDFPLHFVLILVCRWYGIYLIFILLSDVQKSFLCIEVSVFLYLLISTAFWLSVFCPIFHHHTAR